jgi:hypothetical protein
MHNQKWLSFRRLVFETMVLIMLPGVLSNVPLASDSLMLGLQVCTTIPCWRFLSVQYKKVFIAGLQWLMMPAILNPLSSNPSTKKKRSLPFTDETLE